MRGLESGWGFPRIYGISSEASGKIIRLFGDEIVTPRHVITSAINNFGGCKWKSRSRASVVYIATGYGPDDRGVGVRVPVGSRIFSSPRRPGQFWCSLSLLSNGYRGLFPRGVKRQGRKTNHSPPASAEVKQMWICTSIPTYAFMA
jgi:hypothetical protein